MAIPATPNPSTKLNGASRLSQVGLPCSRSGAIVLDQYFYQYGADTTDTSSRDNAKLISIGTTGDLVFEHIDGTPSVLWNRIGGTLQPLVCRRILTSFDFGSSTGVVTTTATNLSWLGGE